MSQRGLTLIILSRTKEERHWGGHYRTVFKMEKERRRRRKRRDWGHKSPIKATPPVTSLPPTRPRLLEVPPSLMKATPPVTSLPPTKPLLLEIPSPPIKATPQ
jgi:hypothetical protein